MEIISNTIKGDTGSVGPQGEQGEQGEKGEDGADGQGKVWNIKNKDNWNIRDFCFHKLVNSFFHS